MGKTPDETLTMYAVLRDGFLVRLDGWGAMLFDTQEEAEPHAHSEDGETVERVRITISRP